MHEPTQLDLFQKPMAPMKRRASQKRTPDASPAGNVLRLFPFARRKSLVAAVAERLLASGSRKAKQAAWDRLVFALSDEVRTFGGDEGDVVRQLCAFHEAVDVAIQKERSEGNLRGAR